MSGARLASLLVGSGAAPAAEVARAQQRRALYGGSLDTVLLELGMLDEQALTARLAEAAALPAVPRERLAAPDPEAASLMTAEEARRLRAVPLGRDGDRIELAVHPDAPPEPIAAWAAARGTSAAPLVIPEVRWRELLAMVYGEPMPARFCALLGKMMGAERARRVGGAPRVVPPPLVDTGPPRPRGPGPEPEIDIVEDAPAAPPERRATVPGRPVAALVIDSATAKREIPSLIERLGDRNPQVVTAAQTALVNLSRQDFGTSRRAWSSWWSKASQRHRAEWLLEALGHKRGDLRLAASQELQALTGVYFGYHFDLPERDREQARRRWTEWWHAVGKPRLGQERQ